MGLVNVNANTNINLSTDYYNPNFSLLGNPFNVHYNPNFSLLGNPFNVSYNSSLMTIAKLLNSNIDLNLSPNAYESSNKVNNKPSLDLKNVGYNPSKGQKLANIAKQNATGFKGLCATYVKKDIEKAGLGKYEYGHAFQCADILRRNPNFKEISTKGLDLSSLPAGCVLVYGKKVAKYNPKYGHIEITDGNGNAYSDGKTGRIRPGAKVFVPVSTNYMA
mgnify:CR=1 FL=1